MKWDYPWPPLPNSHQKPQWTGNGFRLENRMQPILTYEVGASGWTDELTNFHEKTAGENHFIDLALRQHALRQLKKYLQRVSPIILEVGCPSGYMLRLIRERLPHAFLIGSNYVSGPLMNLARQMPHIPLLQFDLTHCPLSDESIDTIVLLNVLEHIGDNGAAMRQIFRILKPGGIAVIEVPAGPKLYDIYDKLLRHHRRYSLTALRNLPQTAGLRIVGHSHLGFFIYPGFWWVKRRNR